MPTITKETAKTTIEQLIHRYLTLPEPDLESESNVRANSIDPLFAALGQPIHDPVHYNREEYVRGVGFVDIALKLNPTDETPLIFVEANGSAPLNTLIMFKTEETTKLPNCGFKSLVCR